MWGFERLLTMRVQNTSHYPAYMGQVISRGNRMLGVVNDPVILPGKKGNLLVWGDVWVNLGARVRKGAIVRGHGKQILGKVMEVGPDDGTAKIFVTLAGTHPGTIHSMLSEM